MTSVFRNVDDELELVALDELEKVELELESDEEDDDEVETELVETVEVVGLTLLVTEDDGVDTVEVVVFVSKTYPPAATAAITIITTTTTTATVRPRPKLLLFTIKLIHIRGNAVI